MSENNCAVYMHVNLINGKKYIGITTREPEKRWQNGHGYYKNTHFMNAIRKYGWDNFAHFVLYKNIPIKIARNIEETLIDEHMSYDPRFGYNKTMGGELEIPSEEAREKMRKNNPMKRPEVAAKHKEAINRPEVLEAKSEAMKGDANPMKRPEVAAKNAKALKEYYENNPEARDAISKALSKPVEAIDPKTGKRVYWFSSTMEAGRAGFHQGNVCSCCLGKRKMHARLIWRYVQEVNEDDTNSGQ